MLKGYQKRLIMMPTRESPLFESAYFILRKDSRPKSPTKNEMLSEATRILEENRDKMEQVVAFLLENDAMTGKQFQDCMAGNQIRQAGENSIFENFSEE